MKEVTQVEHTINQNKSFVKIISSSSKKVKHFFEKEKGKRRVRRQHFLSFCDKQENFSNLKKTKNWKKVF